MITIVVTNNKGGSGKTTSVLHLGQAFAATGLRTLLIDADGQANLTAAFGITEEHLDRYGDLSTVLTAQTRIDRVICSPQGSTTQGKPALIPADKRVLDDIAHDMATPSKIGWLFRLQGNLRSLAKEADIVLIDTPPNLGTLTYAALLAADWVVIPTQAERWSIDGVSRVIDKLTEMRKDIGTAPQLLGTLATQVELETNQHKEGIAYIRNYPYMRFLGHIPKRKGQQAADQLSTFYASIAKDITVMLGLRTAQATK